MGYIQIEMFRHTITFLFIFMVLNHDFIAARSIDLPQVAQNVEQSEPQSPLNEEEEWLESDSDDDGEHLEGRLQ